MKTNINWKDFNKFKPNDNTLYPLIPCLVYVSDPKYLKGGIIRSIRWDTKTNDWFEEDLMTIKYYLVSPYRICFFIESEFINIPKY